MALSLLIAVFLVSGVTLAIMMIIANLIEVVDQRKEFAKWKKSRSPGSGGSLS